MRYPILCNLYRYGTACEIGVIYYIFYPLLYNSNVSLENCPSNFSNVPLNFDEWDRMSPLYPDLDRSLCIHVVVHQTGELDQFLYHQ